MKGLKITVLVVALLALSAAGQFFLASRRVDSAPAFTQGALAALGGFRSIAAEVIWFRADRLQEEGRYVELAQLASLLTFMEPHTTEVWSYAAWNLAYNISVMMPTPEDRWRWVLAAVRLLRDEGLVLNPNSPELCRELAWLFELKIGTDIDSAAAVYRAKWKEIVEDVQKRGAWDELKMDTKRMLAIEHATGFDDWTDPQMSAMYWASIGGFKDIIRQARAIYKKNRSQ
jgi:hypothetical protein